MKNWNKIGKIKAIILLIIALLNLATPFQSPEILGFGMVIIPCVMASLSIPLLLKMKITLQDWEIVKPSWNDNPLSLKKPISSFQFAAFFFLAIGISLIISTGIKFHTLNIIGLSIISFGIGLFLGIFLTLKWNIK
jgi:hypothetical protein